MNVDKRIELEKRVVSHLIRVMMNRGWNVHGVDDGEETHHNLATEAEVIEHAFAVDEANIFFRHIEHKSTHRVFLVFGNDGYDVIADHTYSANNSDDFNDIMDKEMTPFCDKLAEEVYA